MLEDYLETESILLVPSNRKRSMIQELAKTNTFVKIKVLSIEEVIRKFYFDYDEKTKLYLFDEEKIAPELIDIYLKNMYFLNESSYDSEKLNYLVSLKDKLLEKGLLYHNPSFETLLKRKKILVFRSLLDDRGTLLVQDLAKITEVIYLDEVSITKEPLVYAFETIEEEVRFVAVEILKLKEKGIPFSKIHLVGVTNEYEVVLPRVFSFYHILLDIEEKSTLYGTVLGQRFLEIVSQKGTMEEVISTFDNDKDNPYYDLLLEVGNLYSDYSGPILELLPLLKMELKNKKLKSTIYQEEVSVDPLYTSYEEDDYVFLLGFNQENFPITFQDKDYLTDMEKQKLGLFTSLEKTKLEKKRLLHYLRTFSNLTITYKEKSAFDSFYPSVIIKEENWEVKKPLETNEIYSIIDERLRFAKELDELYKFGTKTEKLSRHFKYFKDFPYQTYSNQFMGITKEKMYASLNNKLKLSYTTINEYYQCHFKYYAGRILNLNPTEDTFVMKIGNIFHGVLKEAFLPGFDFNNSFQKNIKDVTFSKKEEWLLGKLKEELVFVIETIKKQMETCFLDQAYYEEGFTIPQEGVIPVVFTGFIDKLLYHTEQDTFYVTVIDYKTGILHDDFHNAYYGLDMQLPVYLYLVKNSPRFTKVRFVGFYLQKILNNEIAIALNKSYVEQKEEKLRLVGYSNSDEAVLTKMDSDYVNSKVIKGMKVSSKGFYSYSKVLNDKEIDALCNLVEAKIKEATKEILEGNFIVNPKQIGDDLVSCEHCPFRELCYRKNEDIEYLEKIKDFSYLGGDDDAPMDEGTTASN